MKREIKKTFWLLGFSIFFWFTSSLLIQYTYSLKNESLYLKSTMLFFLTFLIFIFFIASFISNLIKFRKDKEVRKHLFLLSIIVLSIFLFFLYISLAPGENEKLRNDCMKNGYPYECKNMIIWGCHHGYDFFSGEHCHSFEDIYGDCLEEDYHNCGITHTH